VTAGAASLVVLLYAMTALTGEIRTWSSATGTYKTEAELVQLKDDGTVVLKKKDGGVIEVPLSKLSAADQQYLRTQTKGKPGSSKPGSSSPGRGTPAAGKGVPSAGAPGATPGKSPSAPAPAAGKSANDPPKTPEETEAEAQLCRTAKEALLIYKFYLAKPNLTVLQRGTAEANLKAWQKRADEDQVRLGAKWMPKAEADKIREKADAKIEMAMEMLRLNNGAQAQQYLQEASELDPDSIKADFLMGVVWGVINNDRKSQIHFERCLKREPGNVSVLNNLAVSLASQKKFVDAAKYWKTAATNAPKMKALAQNIGSLITMAGSNQAKLPPKTMSELSEVYEGLITTHGNPRPTRIGFVFTPPYGSDWASGKGKRGGGGKGESVVVGSGSGFVVHPHIILTNRHVIEHASGLLVLDPKNSKAEPMAAELIAIADGKDLALVRCNKLDAPPVRLIDKLPPRGTDIMVLGYPLGPSFGTALKSTRGSMVAMPDAQVDNMCLYDALTNPGNSGGPLCDQSGRVAAVVCAVTGSVGGTYGAAIPIADAIPFLRKQVPDLAASLAEAEKLDWPAVDALVSPSTVLILKKENLESDTGVGDGKR